MTLMVPENTPGVLKSRNIAAAYVLSLLNWKL